MNEIDFGAQALWTVLAVSALATLAALGVFRRLTDSAGLHLAVNQIAAHLYELRLFLDEPIVVFRAQLDLIRDHRRLFRILAWPSAALALPFALLFVVLNAFYGHAALPVGEPAIVTLQLSGSSSGFRAPPKLIAPDGIQVETPAVRAIAARQVSWRIRPAHALAGNVQVVLDGRPIGKTVAAGGGIHYLSCRRSGGVAAFLPDPVELPFQAPGAEWIEISYPGARIEGLPWWLWFAAGSAATAIAYRLLR